PPLPAEDDLAALHDSGLHRLGDGGWRRYEVSALARAGRACEHNLNYWGFGDYLGIGAGAHGKLTHAGLVRRYSKPRHPAAYVARRREFRIGERIVAGDDLLFEYLLNALRLRGGFDIADFTARTGLGAGLLQARIATLIDERLLETDSGRVRATDRGFDYLNEILERLLPEPGAASRQTGTRT
ncbi:MAG: hypothetical protein DWQ08_10690, partial [Proteobacteria bacterium]